MSRLSRAAPSRLLPRNRILLALSPTELAMVLPDLERVSLELRDVLYDVDVPIEHVYFPETCVVSVMGVMADGTSVETATVGYEGMLGLPIFHGTDRTSSQSFCQIPGDAIRMTSPAFRRAVERSKELSAILHRYSQALFTLVAQSSACNRVHSIEQRCARWLLHTHDRVDGIDDIPLTQEFLAQMLGVRRASVSDAMSGLQAEGWVRYSMGRVRVTDRQGLERGACECYAIIRREFDRLLNGSVAQHRPVSNPLLGIRTQEDNKTILQPPAPTAHDPDSP
jgi:CRP-like cAMP-binding protein